MSDKKIPTRLKETIDVLTNKRKSMGLRQGDIAKKIGVSQTHLSMIENGKRMPSVDILYKYFDAVGLVEMLVEKLWLEKINAPVAQ